MLLLLLPSRLPSMASDSYSGLVIPPSKPVISICKLARFCLSRNPLWFCCGCSLGLRRWRTLSSSIQARNHPALLVLLIPNKTQMNETPSRKRKWNRESFTVLNRCCIWSIIQKENLKLLAKIWYLFELLKCKYLIFLIQPHKINHITGIIFPHWQIVSSFEENMTLKAQ